MLSLSPAEARRVAVAAQGFTGRRTGPCGVRAVAGLVRRLAAVQIDSVSAVARSHYLPAFSRLGPYTPGHLDTVAYRRREAFECWGHQASFVPTDLHHALRWRMARHADAAVAATDASIDGRGVALARARPTYVAAVLAQVAEGGPLAAGDLDDAGPGRGPWWGWTDGKIALEHLFAAGALAVAGRRGFARLYDLPERVIPDDVLARPTPPRDDAQRELVERSARALGVATVADLADYFRLRVDVTAARARELEEDGVLVAARVPGWGRAYLHRDARVPRRVAARALVSPFDSLVWDRDRTERVFGFRYRIEIYTPRQKRVYGYYVLPFLLGDRIAARVDVRADRAGGVLAIPAAFAEPGHRPDAVAPALAAEVRLMAGWLGLGRVEVGDRGDLAAPLRRAVGAAGHPGPPSG